MKEKEFKPVYESENDCYLVAYCACFNVSYQEAQKTGITHAKKKIIEVIEKQGYKYNQVLQTWTDSYITLADFSQKYNQGTYYVLLSKRHGGNQGHAVAMIDGTVYDAKNHVNYNNFLVDGYFCINNKRASVKNSYLSNQQELSDYALDYVQKKLSINPMSEDTYIKVTRKGTNNLTVFINGDQIADINFPFDSSKQQNERLIKKEIDKYKM